MKKDKEYQIKGKLCKRVRSMSEQDIYNSLRDYGFYDLEIREIKCQK